MKRSKSTLISSLVILTGFLAFAPAVFAQYEYEYTYGTSTANSIGPVLLFWCIWGCACLFILACIAFRVWMLVHVLQNAPEDKKVSWALLVGLVPVVPIVYFFTKREEWSQTKSVVKKDEKKSDETQKKQTKKETDK
jgi:type VI protein secretion system component VasK